jgi:hypothetical protein
MPVTIINIRSPKPLLLGKIGESQRKLAEQKICPRRNWRISQFLVLKNRKSPFFHNFLFKIPIIPIWPLNSFFPSKTSLYRLKVIFRIKKLQKKLWHPSHCCVKPLCREKLTLKKNFLNCFRQCSLCKARKLKCIENLWEKVVFREIPTSILVQFRV